MRVLLIGHWFPPVVSGSSYYAQSLAHSLQASGHEVVMVTLDWGKEFAPDPGSSFPVHCLPVIRIPKLPFFYNLRLMGFSFTPGNYKRLLKIVREFEPQIIHCTNHIFDSNFLATAVAKATGTPIVGSVTTPIQHQTPWIQSLYRLADRWTIGWFGVRKWDGIVSLDRVVYEYIGEVYGSRVQKKSVVIPFGVKLESMPLYENPLPQRSPRPQILFVGHIHPFRNPTQLVLAMEYVLEEIPNARLILAGRVDLKEPVRAAKKLGLTEDQIQFLGETPHEQSVELMKSSHVFATWVTGPYASLGTAPMEAMLCRTPVVCDLHEDLFGEGKLKDGENIILVNSKDPQDIAQNLIRLLKDDLLRQKIGEGGRRFVLDWLDWNQIVQEMESFYRKVLDGKDNKDLSIQEIPERVP